MIFKNKKYWIGGLLLFTIFFIISYYNNDSFQLNNSISFNTNNDSYKIKYSSNDSLAIVFIYIGSSSCIHCNKQELINSVRNLKVLLQEKAEKLGLGYTVIGISKDYIITNGIRHLLKIGNLDEIMTGNSWQNTGALKYIYGNIPGKAATPQIIVTLRKLKPMITTFLDTTYVGIDEEIQIVRKVGSNQIESWNKQGAPLPNNLLNFFKSELV